MDISWEFSEELPVVQRVQRSEQLTEIIQMGDTTRRCFQHRYPCLYPKLEDRSIEVIKPITLLSQLLHSNDPDSNPSLMHLPHEDTLFVSYLRAWLYNLIIENQVPYQKDTRRMVIIKNMYNPKHCWGYGDIQTVLLEM